MHLRSSVQTQMMETWLWKHWKSSWSSFCIFNFVQDDFIWNVFLNKSQIGVVVFTSTVLIKTLCLDVSDFTNSVNKSFWASSIPIFKNTYLLLKSLHWCWTSPTAHQSWTDFSAALSSMLYHWPAIMLDDAVNVSQSELCWIQCWW